MLSLALLSVPLVATADTEPFHQEILHDMAHFGGGVCAAWWMHQADRNLPIWGQVGLEVMSACAAQCAYKTLANEWSDPHAPERVFVGSLGGLVFIKF